MRIMSLIVDIYLKCKTLKPKCDGEKQLNVML